MSMVDLIKMFNLIQAKIAGSVQFFNRVFSRINKLLYASVSVLVYQNNDTHADTQKVVWVQIRTTAFHRLKHPVARICRHDIASKRLYKAN